MLKKYKAKYNVEPSLPLFNAWGYDGLMLICDALKNGNKTPEAIKKHLYNLKDFPGFSNTINFNSSGSSPVTEKMYRIVGGEFVLLE